MDDRSKFIEQLVEAIFSIQQEDSANRSEESRPLPELPKAPKEVSGPKVSELKAKAEAEQHALRRLRMCLRDVCNRILYDKRFSVFHYPVSDEDAPNYHSIVQNPMDMATLLQRVDCGQYLTRATFMQDFDLIVANAKAYNGDDYNGSRIVSRAYELRDVVQGMLSQMDPALVSFCDKIAAQGGPVHVADDMEGLCLPSLPVVQLASVTRTSARLRNVQPEINLSQSYEALKRAKKNSESEQPGLANEEKLRALSEPESSKPSSSHASPPPEPDTNVISKRLENSPVNEIPEFSSLIDDPSSQEISQDTVMIDADFCEQVRTLKQRLMECTNDYGVPQLERLYPRLLKGVMTIKNREGHKNHKTLILSHLLKFVEDDNNF